MVLHSPVGDFSLPRKPTECDLTLFYVVKKQKIQHRRYTYIDKIWLKIKRQQKNTVSIFQKNPKSLFTDGEIKRMKASTSI